MAASYWVCRYVWYDELISSTSLAATVPSETSRVAYVSGIDLLIAPVIPYVLANVSSSVQRNWKYICRYLYKNTTNICHWSVTRVWIFSFIYFTAQRLQSKSLKLFTYIFWHMNSKHKHNEMNKVLVSKI